MNRYNTVIEIVRCDAAGPNSKIALNTTALFYRERGGPWVAIDVRSERKVQLLIRGALGIEEPVNTGIRHSGEEKKND